MKTNKKGFSTVEIIILLAVISLIGGAGWYVWQANKTTRSETASKNSSDSLTNNAQAGTDDSLVSIQEWGITIKPASRESFMHSVEGDNLVFTTKELVQSDDYCKLENRPYIIRRLHEPVYKPGDLEPVEFNDIVTPKKQATDGKYYFILPSGSPCTFDEEARRSIDQKSLIESIEPLN